MSGDSSTGHQRTDHKFAHEYLSYDAGVTLQRKRCAVEGGGTHSNHHTSPEDKARLKKIGQQVLDFDGCSTVWLRSWEDYEAFFTSGQMSTIRKDGELFMDTSSITVYAGNDMIAFGKAIPGVDKSDGITTPNTTF